MMKEEEMIDVSLENGTSSKNYFQKYFSRAYLKWLLPSYFIGLGITSYFGFDASAASIAAETLIPLIVTPIAPIVQTLWYYHTRDDEGRFASNEKSETAGKKFQRGAAVATTTSAMVLCKLGIDDLANKTITTDNPQTAIAQYNAVFAAQVIFMIAIYANGMYALTPKAKDKPQNIFKPIIEPVRFLYDLFTCCGACFNKVRDGELLISRETCWKKCWDCLPSMEGVSTKLSSCWGRLWGSSASTVNVSSSASSSSTSTSSTLQGVTFDG